jgi:hypothetical protein
MYSEPRAKGVAVSDLQVFWLRHTLCMVGLETLLRRCSVFLEQWSHLWAPNMLLSDHLTHFLHGNIWKHMETQEFSASRSHKFPQQIERTRWRLLQLTTAQYCRSDYRLPSSKPVGWFGRLINVVPSSVLLFVPNPQLKPCSLKLLFGSYLQLHWACKNSAVFLPFSPHAGCNAALTFASQNASAAIPGHSPSNRAFDFGSTSNMFAGPSEGKVWCQATMASLENTWKYQILRWNWTWSEIDWDRPR